jgi:hypothetical protein
VVGGCVEPAPLDAASTCHGQGHSVGDNDGACDCFVYPESADRVVDFGQANRQALVLLEIGQRAGDRAATVRAKLGSTVSG